ncbi:hypothetical protein SAMN02745163_02384 [Clostridium cavendishii DSM 21758]|uniref:Uncharacterized protein n=1 Tax=Clostridium cavendishii DSM 21758 TaxID=1121302 RepID=A0A1M6LHJ8_9CLOT|nr:hypothetical protein [Clostridium cavendishii]SHJ70679.1 hypothetical protein SAMN02745163_02384 [Clostridium cavendishii DSM 21758]
MKFFNRKLVTIFKENNWLKISYILIMAILKGLDDIDKNDLSNNKKICKNIKGCIFTKYLLRYIIINNKFEL